MYRAGFWGSAVCSFTVDAINGVLDSGPFKGQQSFETGWFSVPERDVPVPRPGQASPTHSTLLHVIHRELFHLAARSLLRSSLTPRIAWITETKRSCS